MTTNLKVATASLLVLLMAGAASADGPAISPLALEGPEPLPVEAVDNEAIDAAIERGLDFLVARQNKEGSWGSARNTKGLNIFAPVPGAHHAFRAAVTSLCISAIIDCGTDDAEVIGALERAEVWLMEFLPRVRRADPEAIYNSWCHAYAIQALVRMHERLPDDRKRQKQIFALIEDQVEMLNRFEVVDGGWCYYDFDYHTKKPAGSSISFVTATVLVAFHEAQQIGIEIPEHLVTRGMDSIVRQRNPDFTYCYGEYLKYQPRRGINRPGGSLGRSQACNIAMRYWGDELVTDGILNNWLDRLFARNMWLDIGRKRPIPHESWMQIAGYFYYYGHYYAALCIEVLPPEDQDRHKDQLARLMFKHQESDGCWWDYPFYDYHQQYGTAYAISTLARCRKAEK